MKTPDDVLAAGSRIGDRYVIERRLGAGAMGSVYAARAASEPASGPARFAIKALLAATTAKGDAEERRARFMREAAVCANIKHPNVVPVVDHGIDEATGIPFLVMPLLVGEDLASVLDRVGCLEPETAIALVVQACEGLAAAHALGVVHRDVKPSNLFLEGGTGDDGASVAVKVTDFGLAKALDEAPGSPGALTGTGRFMGTPQYVSPEQAISAKHVDLRTDVYSLAMSLYHALAGRPAFAYVRSFMGMVLELTAREAPSLQEAAPWVPAQVARIVHAALKRDPGARCPSALELALALDFAVGIDASRRPVTGAALRPLSDTTRARLAPVAELPSSWEELLRI
ncbi:MAG TPA: serine/threonine-protein kinase [Polyangiaceae bacterium]